MNQARVSRRTFVQCTVLGGLVAGAASLVLRSPREPDPIDALCRRPIACGQCALFDNCTLQKRRDAEAGTTARGDEIDLTGVAAASRREVRHG